VNHAARDALKAALDELFVANALLHKAHNLTHGTKAGEEVAAVKNKSADAYIALHDLLRGLGS
jgi:hypothetical protein